MKPSKKLVDSLRVGIDVLVRVFRITDSITLPNGGPKLNPSDSQALLFIYENPKCISAELGNHLGLSPTTISSILDRLTKHDFVSRSRTESNRRVVQLEVTARGKETIELILGEQRNHCRIMLESLPKEMRKQFVECIAIIADDVRNPGAE